MRTLTIDDGRHGKHGAVAVVDDRVRRLVFNNVKEMPQVAVCLYEPGEQHSVSSKKKEKMLIWPMSSELAVYLVEAHELRGRELFGLVQRFEADVSRGFGCVCERTRDGVQVMSPDRHQAPLPSQNIIDWIIGWIHCDICLLL